MSEQPAPRPDTPQRPTGPSRKDYGDWYLAHVDRMWEAEREVAARWSERSKTLLTSSAGVLAGILAVTGGGLTRVGRLDYSWAVIVLLSAAAVTLAWTMWHLLRVPFVLLVQIERSEPPSRRSSPAPVPGQRRRPDTASYHLWPPAVFSEWAESRLSSVALVLGLQVVHAAEDLQRRNLVEHRRIQRAENELGRGLIAAFANIVLLLVVILVGSVQVGRDTVADRGSYEQGEHEQLAAVGD